jgi:hypothetical protein
MIEVPHHGLLFLLLGRLSAGYWNKTIKFFFVQTDTVKYYAKLCDVIYLNNEPTATCTLWAMDDGLAGSKFPLRSSSLANDGG